jgi:hypothetical protein
MDLTLLRSALDDYELAETDDERARCIARVISLAKPRLLRNMIIRLDELEAEKAKSARGTSPP